MLHVSKQGSRDARKRQGRFCTGIEGNTMKQKLEKKKKNYARDNIGKIRVIVDVAVTSLETERINKSPQKLCQLNLQK